MKIACVVMASLTGSSAPEERLLKPYFGKPALEHTLNSCAQAGFFQILTVTRSRAVAQTALRLGFPYLLYRLPDARDGIRLAVEQMSASEGILLIAPTRPLMTPLPLMRAEKAMETCPGCVVRLLPDEGALFPSACYPSLLTLARGQPPAQAADAPVVDVSVKLGAGEGFLNRGGEYINRFGKGNFMGGDRG